MLSSSANAITRAQYVRCWQRRARFCACVDTSPCLTTTQVGRGDILIDLTAWGYKLIGTQHITIDKRFFPIRFIHISDGYGDLPLRAFRAKSTIRSNKLRDKTCKKPHFNTDLSGWVHRAFSIDNADVPGDTLQLWVGMLLSFLPIFAYRNYSIRRSARSPLSPNLKD